MYVVLYNNVAKRIAEVLLCSILSDRLFCRGESHLT
jgi:hypothetical protein